MKSGEIMIEKTWLWLFSDGNIVAFDGVTLGIVLPREDFSLVLAWKMECLMTIWSRGGSFAADFGG